MSALTVLAVVTVSLQLLAMRPALAFELPGDVAGHVEVSGLLDVSAHTCATLTGGAETNGYMTSKTTYDYVMPSPQGMSAGNAIDHHWVQDDGGSSLSAAMRFSLPKDATAVDLFPNIDHGPVPGEAFESTVYGFDDPAAPTTSWEVGDISTVFVDGWSDWVTDDFVSRWEFTTPHRYFAVRWGGPKAMVADGDDEIDALCAPQLTPTGLTAGPDQVVTEGDPVTLQAKLTGGSSSLGTYHWKLAGASGPPVTLSSPDNATATFQALDDGVYHFTVTADAAGQTFNAAVQVTVRNAVPVIASAAKPTADDKLAMVTTTLTDGGVVDTHTARYDWGDGSPVESLPVMQGAGWGYAYAGHVYAALGSYLVKVTVTDDDGGVSQVATTTVDVGGAGRATPQLVPSLWSASETAKSGIDLTGDGTTIDALVHSNHDIRVAGNGKHLSGGTEYAGQLTVSGTGHTFTPAAVTAAVAPYPVEWLLSDYAPGGPVAQRLGAAYVDDSAHCTPSGWQPTTPLSNGVHWAPCNVRIRDGVLDGRQVTLVATGGIDVITTGDVTAPYDDSLQFLTGSGSAKAIKIAGSGTRFDGVSFAPGGGIEISGSTHTFGCGLLGQNVSISGSGNKFQTNGCAYNTQQSNTIPVAAPPVVVPQLVTAIDAAPRDVAPGGSVAYAASLTNSGSLLAVPVLYGAANSGTTVLSVSAVSATLEYFDEPAQLWTTLGATGGRLSLASRSIASPGAHYATDVPGSTVDPNGLSAWSGVASMTLTPAEIAKLVDDTTVSSLRIRVQLTTSGGRARLFTRAADNLIDEVRLSRGVARDATATVIPAVGQTSTSTSSGVPALALLKPGDSVPLAASSTVPEPAARVDSETSDAYLARLGALDGRSLVGGVYGDARADFGRVLAAESTVRGHERVALIEPRVIAAESTTLGKDVSVDVRLTNNGTAAAAGLQAQLMVSGLGAVALSGVPATLAPGQQAVAHATAHPTAAGPITASAEVTWVSPGSDVRFGPTDASTDSRVIAASDHPVTLGSVSGQFFNSAADATSFTAHPGDIPVFAQSFPLIDFNPPAGVLPGDPGVDPSTKPFTDVLVGPDAKPAGILPAAVRDHAAGTGDLSSFQAVFSGVVDVSSAGPVTLSVISDDGFVLGIDGATRVSGPMDGAPSATPFSGFPVVASHNVAGDLGTYPVTVNFPAAGRYSFEMDYFTRAGDSMSLVLTHAGTPGTAGGGRVFLTGHDPDFHAVEAGGNTTGARHMIQQAIAYVTGRKADPKILLVTDVRNPGGGYVDSRQGLRVSGFTTFDVADDGSGGSGVLDLHTVDFTQYDVIVVASDFGGWLRQAELDVLNARTADIQSYLTAGGGLVAFAQGSPAGSLTTHDRLAFVGCAPTGMDEFESGFRITAQGLAVGLNQTDLNGNYSHSKFDSTCGLDVLDTDLAGNIITLSTPGTVAGPTRVVPPTNYLLLTPTSSSQEVGSQTTITAYAADAAGDARSGVSVTLDVSQGPDNGTYYGVTDAAGHASFPFASRSVGADDAVATALIADDPAVSNFARLTWTSPTAGGDTGGDTGGDPGSGATGAAVSAIAPVDGTRMSTPTPVSATLTAPDGATIASWKIELVPAGGGTPTVLATGNGGAAVVTAAATVDPTALVNGLYVVRIVSVTSEGGRNVTTSTVLADGDFKPGRMTTSFLDHQVGIGGLPLQVTRSYDSFDQTAGDFGVGWRVGLANFRIARAIPLGQSGWQAKSDHCGLIFCTLKYTSTVPHSVSVVWPDGHQEVFDLTGVDGSTFFPGLARAKFEAHQGTDTTSTLEVVGDDSLFFIGDSAFAGAFGSDGIFDPTTFKLTDSNGTQYVIDRAHGLQTVTDRDGNTLTFTPDGVTSSYGKSITYTRDGTGRITRIVSPVGTTTYGYDHGDLVSSTDLNGVVTTYGYDGDHNLKSVQGPGGRSLGSAEYDAAGRMTAWIDGNGNRSVLDTNVGAGQESVTDPEGRLRTVATYDDKGDLVRTDQIFDGKTYVTRLTYNARHQLLTRSDPAGGTSTLTRDPDHGWITSRTDEAGHVGRVAYNDRGQPTSYTRADGTVLETWEYDTRGHLLTDTPAVGPVATMTYDGGRIATVSRNGTVIQSYTYDALGRPKTVTDASGRTIAATYDDAGRLLTQTGGRSGAQTFTYDAVGHPITATNAKGGTRSWTWGPLGDLDALTDTLGRTTRFTYDDAHHLMTRVDRNGDTTSYEYDRDGRPVEVTMPGRTLGYTYDGLGRAVLATADGVTTDLSYDKRSQLAGVTTSGTGLPAMAFAYAHDPSGAMTGTTGPGGTETFGYDANGVLSSVKDLAGGTFGFTFDAAGRLRSMTRPNSVTDALTYDAAGRLATQIQTLAGQRVTGVSYGYDTQDRVSSMTDDAGSHGYSYDANSNLAQANHPVGFAVPDESFTYDVLGNRLSDRNDPAGSMTYDAGQRLTRDATFDYAYDGEGSLVRKTARSSGAVTSYTWSADHLMRSVTNQAGQTSYRYDALGRRVQATAPDGTVTTWAYDGQDIRAVYRGQGSAATLVRTFSVSPSGSPLSTQDQASGSVSYPVTDNTGSVTGSLDASGALVGVTQYGAFGDPHAVNGGTGDDFSFTGHAYDPGTDLVYARARYYDPASGRFLSQDPVGSANPYTYAANQPANLVDPTGAMAVEYVGELSAGVEEAGAVVEASADLEAFAAEQALNIPRGGLQAVLKGSQGVDAVVGVLEDAGFVVDQEVTMAEAAQGGLRTRLDLLISRTLENGQIERFFIEVKTGPTAGLTANQGSLFPTLADTGLFARGANALAAGLEIGEQYILPGFIIWL